MNRIKLFISAIVIFVVSITCILFHSFYIKRSTNELITVEIPRGFGLNSIAGLLEKNDVVSNKKLFVIYSYLNGSGNSLKAGEYEFDPGLTIKQVFDKLHEGDVKLTKVTIPEGLTIKEIGEILENKKVVSKNEFVSLANNSDYTRKFIDANIISLEGFLFPDTYSFNKKEKAEFVIDTMVKRFKEVFDEIEGSQFHDIVEIVTKASIIEKETPLNSEKPLVSAVIDNRLKKGIRLACDPTVIYALGDDFDGNLTKKDLQYESPYNTYQVGGLPPGPIASPGKESLEAAINPADVDYLYFVSKGDGSHFFSNNYRSHVNAVNKYIKNKN